MDETFFIDASGGLWHAGANSDGGSPTATANPVPRRVNGVGQLPAAAVLYGYGSREEMEPWNPVLLAQNCEELTQYILG